MYDVNELITIKWTTRNKKYYEDKGYSYTGIGTPLIITVNDLPDDSSIHITATCDCAECTNIQSTPFRNYNNIIRKNGLYRCKPCSFSWGMDGRNQKSHERLYNVFVDMCKEKDCIPITTLEDFGGVDSYVEYICPKHGKTQTLMNTISSSGGWCYQCGKEAMAEKQKLSSECVKNIVESKNGNILLNSNEYLNSSTKNLKVICGSCNRVFTTSLSSINSGNGRCAECGCRVFGELNRITIEELIKMATINDECMLLNPKEYKDMGTKLLFRCTSCGNPFETTPRNYVKRGFTRCHDCNWSMHSLGEVSIKQFLEELNINNIREYRFDDCRDKRTLPFDFFLPDYNAIIEFDGMLHFEPIKYFGGLEKFELLQKHDEIKNNYCKQNNINLLRIPYWESNNIYSIITMFLNNI